MSAESIYGDCVKTNTTHSFGTDENTIYAKYMRGTTGSAGAANGTCDVVASFSSLKLKNGACIYFGANSIKVDINGNEGPNEDARDRMQLAIDSEGISTDMDVALTARW